MLPRLLKLSFSICLLCLSNLYAQTVKTQNDTIKIDSTILLIPVSVKTNRGVGIAGLSKDKFKVFEDGVEQDIAYFEEPGQPITVAIVIDMSDSARMSLADMRKAASSFIDKLESRDKALIVAFDKSVHHVIGATSERDVLKLGMQSINTGGGTALYDTVDHVVRLSFQNIGGRKAVVLLTDGIDTSSVNVTFETSASTVGEGNIAMFPIQYEPENMLAKRLSSENSQLGSPIYTTPSGESISSAYQRGTRYLRLLADSSGGRFQFADSTAKLQAAFEQIALELRQQYYLGFYVEKSASKREKRRLRVTVDVAGAKIESRESYIAIPR